MWLYHAAKTVFHKLTKIQHKKTLFLLENTDQNYRAEQKDYNFTDFQAVALNDFSKSVATGHH